MEANGLTANTVPLAAINDRLSVLEQRAGTRTTAQQSAHTGPTRLETTEPSAQFNMEQPCQPCDEAVVEVRTGVTNNTRKRSKPKRQSRKKKSSEDSSSSSSEDSDSDSDGSITQKGHGRPTLLRMNAVAFSIARSDLITESLKLSVLRTNSIRDC